MARATTPAEARAVAFVARPALGVVLELRKRVFLFLEQDRKRQQYKEHAKHADDQQRPEVTEVVGQPGIGCIKEVGDGFHSLRP